MWAGVALSPVLPATTAEMASTKALSSVTTRTVRLVMVASIVSSSPAGLANKVDRACPTVAVTDSSPAVRNATMAIA
jgi:hypothetical protein